MVVCTHRFRKTVLGGRGTCHDRIEAVEDVVRGVVAHGERVLSYRLLSKIIKFAFSSISFINSSIFSNLR
jgi:hypothetical protein